jgi:hypothetical protein
MDENIKASCAFFRREHILMIPLTVREILDEHIAQKLA